MKKIPTLFKRVYENHRVVDCLPEVTPGMEWVLEGEGKATVKIDGSCCAIIDGTFYKRYDAKKGKTPPTGAIPCSDPDPVTGHWPHWVKVDMNSPSDRWFVKAMQASMALWSMQFEDFLDNSNHPLPDATYEAVGPHFNGNPYELEEDRLIMHGQYEVDVERSFEGIKKWLEENEDEGLVFWKDGEPQCKIKRSDFGLKWP